MSYFTPAEHEALIASPCSIASLYATHRSRFLADLGAGFSAEIEQHLQFGFAGLVAFDLKPYGQSIKSSLADLLAETGLDCDNYAILAWRLFKLLCPAATTRVIAAGWNGGPIGNHAQLHCHLNSDGYGMGGGYWLVDPTIGVMVCGHDFDWVCSGKPLANLIYLKSFHALAGRTGSVTDGLHSAVVDALRFGLYRPMHQLYFYDDLERFVSPAPIADWPTPQASALIP